MLKLYNVLQLHEVVLKKHYFLFSQTQKSLTFKHDNEFKNENRFNKYKQIVVPSLSLSPERMLRSTLSSSILFDIFPGR